jgi:hypothetical protein
MKWGFVVNSSLLTCETALRPICLNSLLELQFFDSTGCEIEKQQDTGVSYAEAYSLQARFIANYADRQVLFRFFDLYSCRLHKQVRLERNFAPEEIMSFIHFVPAYQADQDWGVDIDSLD